MRQSLARLLIPSVHINGHRHHHQRYPNRKKLPSRKKRRKKTRKERRLKTSHDSQSSARFRFIDSCLSVFFLASSFSPTQQLLFPAGYFLSFRPRVAGVWVEGSPKISLPASQGVVVVVSLSFFEALGFPDSHLFSSATRQYIARVRWRGRSEHQGVVEDGSGQRDLFIKWKGTLWVVVVCSPPFCLQISPFVSRNTRGINGRRCSCCRRSVRMEWISLCAQSTLKCHVLYVVVA